MGPVLPQININKKKEDQTKLPDNQPIKAVNPPASARPKYNKEDIYQDYLTPGNAKFDRNRAIDYLNDQGFDTKFMSLPDQEATSGNMMSGQVSIPGLDKNAQLNAALKRAKNYQDEAAKQRTQELYTQTGKDIEALKGQKEGLLHARMQPELRSGRRAIVDKMREMKNFYSKHGLLGSGTAQYEAAKMGADYNQSMEKKRLSEYEGINDEISKLEDLYQRAGLNQSGAQLQSQYQSQLNAIKNSMDEMQGYGEVGKGVGQIAGTYLANRNKSSDKGTP